MYLGANKIDRIGAEQSERDPAEQRLANAAMFFAPFASVRLLGINFTASDLLLTFLFTIVVLRGLHARRGSPHSHGLGSWLLTGWWLIATGYLLSALAAQTAQPSETGVLIAQFAFVLVIAPFTIIRSRVDYLDLLRWYLIGLAVSIAVGYLLQTFAIDTFQALLDSSTLLGGTRRFGAFLGSNALGKTIAVAIPIIFALYARQQVSTTTMVVLLFVLLAGTLLAASNAGFILSAAALFLSLLVVLFGQSSANVKAAVLAALFAVLLIVLRGGWFTTDTLRTRVLEPLFGGDLDEVGSYALKSDLMETAWKIISENPLFGVGAGEFARSHGNGITVHNSYLLTWVEGGLIAFIGLLVVIAGIFCSVLRGARADSTALIWLAIISVLLTLAGMWTGNQPYQRYRLLPLVIYALYLTSPVRGRERAGARDDHG